MLSICSVFGSDSQACPWELDSHGKCEIPWEMSHGMGQHELHFPWDPWDSSNVTAS